MTNAIVILLDDGTTKEVFVTFGERSWYTTDLDGSIISYDWSTRKQALEAAANKLNGRLIV